MNCACHSVFPAFDRWNACSKILTGLIETNFDSGMIEEVHSLAMIGNHQNE